MAAKAALLQMAQAKRAAASVMAMGQYKGSISYSLMNRAGPATLMLPKTWRLYSTESAAAGRNPAQQAKTASTAASSTADASQNAEMLDKLAEEVERCSAKIKELEEKNKEIMDKYKRSLADMENLRMRLNKQIEDAKVFGIQSFCKDLLEVADTLGHATDAVPKNELEDNASLKSLYEGLSMTKAALLQVFKRHGLEPINPLKEKFDPNVHEALFQKEEANVEPNVVVAVTKLGYKLHDRCIRPALVGVSK